ncbi:hypothetical protein CMUST_03305 [Corynebacterium mustelae]|uniref:Uncharacterized protein n=1 Tax=Corynebacterium mustelae TaxID=571915 RepID=A0A0G3GWT3_9CORY|nr:hypothetical protein [Corynebacterium mustelae]AKK05005.1 hypothetical protein CMUST_03305 [Corynebacterium mustelae]
MTFPPNFDFDFDPITQEQFDSLPKVHIQTTSGLASLNEILSGDPDAAYIEHVVSFTELAEAQKLLKQAPSMVGLVVYCENQNEATALLEGNTELVLGGIVNSPEAAAVLKGSFVPYVYLGDIGEQVVYGGSRIVDAVRLLENFRITDDGELSPGIEAGFILDRNLPVLCQPEEAIAAGIIENIADYPLPLLRDFGYNVGLDKWTYETVTALELDIHSYYDLLLSTIETSFLTKQLRRMLIGEVIEPAFAEFFAEDDEAATETEETSKTESEPSELKLSPEELAGIDPQLLEEWGIDPKDIGLT